MQLRVLPRSLTWPLKIGKSQKERIVCQPSFSRANLTSKLLLRSPQNQWVPGNMTPDVPFAPHAATAETSGFGCFETSKISRRSKWNSPILLGNFPCFFAAIFFSCQDSRFNKLFGVKVLLKKTWLILANFIFWLFWFYPVFDWKNPGWKCIGTGWNGEG